MAAVVLIACFAGAVFSETALADGEMMYFGSESYEWRLNISSPIGIYAAADGSLESVKYTIAYDPDMLEYDGDEGEITGEGEIHFEFTGLNEDINRILISFTPRMGGGTQIYIKDATVTAQEGDPVELDDIYVNVSAPIQYGCHLDGITVNGTSLPDFDTNTAIYTYTLDEYAEEVEITAEPDVGVEISDTHLEEGNNWISIWVENASGQRAQYQVLVINPENTAVPVPVGEIEEDVADEETVNTEQDEIEEAAAEEEVEEEEVVSLVEDTAEEEDEAVQDETFLRRLSRLSSEFRTYTRNNTILCLIAIVVVVGGIYLWIVYRRSKRRHQKRTQEWRERKEAKLEDQKWERAVHEAMETEDKTPEIIVSGITMDFNVEHDQPTSLKETVIRTLKRDRKVEAFRALDDISFTVNEGEVVGIIGTNGSGKSTLLKIISGALIPTKGRTNVDRDKVQLLTLGTGFDFELTGRENVYLNGAIIGYTKEFIDEKYDDIVKFAELDGFMDEKVRNYSSGMVSRLGFAIATIRDTPEILILDEVLSVGDLFFRKKSEARIQEMIHGGSTVLIVSHSMGVIRKNCTKVVWIEKGKLRMVGKPKEVCEAYVNMQDSEAVE